MESTLTPILASQFDRDRLKNAPEGQSLSQTLCKRETFYGKKDEVAENVEKALDSKDGKTLLKTLTKNNLSNLLRLTEQ